MQEVSCCHVWKEMCLDCGVTPRSTFTFFRNLLLFCFYLFLFAVAVFLLYFYAFVLTNIVALFLFADFKCDNIWGLANSIVDNQGIELNKPIALTVFFMNFFSIFLFGLGLIMLLCQGCYDKNAGFSAAIILMIIGGLFLTIFIGIWGGRAIAMRRVERCIPYSHTRLGWRGCVLNETIVGGDDCKSCVGTGFVMFGLPLLLLYIFLPLTTVILACLCRKYRVKKHQLVDDARTQQCDATPLVTH